MLKIVKWNNYKSLGNLKLDFCKPDGNAYPTIILAGENGTGKTTILETLGQFLTGHSMEPFEYMEYDANGKQFHIEPDKTHSSLGFHNRREINSTSVNNIRTNHNNNADDMHNDRNDVRSYGCVYSSAKSKFGTKAVTTTTTEQIDKGKYAYDSDNVDFTSIKQLFVDIISQDNNSFAKNAQEHESVKWTEFEPTSKMYRFKKAFGDFFCNMNFYKIDDSLSSEKRVIFRKNGYEIPVDDLSTGEKQIVFRGAYLLRNIGKIDGGIILIDEPELSMHPKWQEKILSFYRNLFICDGEQKAQIIMATHSEYIVKKALEDKENTLVIILENENGIVNQTKVEAPYLLLHLTSAEINFKAFGIYSVDYHIELYGRLQEKTGYDTIRNMDNYIKAQSIYNNELNKSVTRNGTTSSESLPTYIRNAIDHPDNPNRSYTDDELKQSTSILIKLIEAIP